MKTFEEYQMNEEGYFAGDYLLININGEKVKAQSIFYTTTYDRGMYVELANGKSKNIIKRSIYRMLFPSEIKEFEIEKEAEKYNL